MLIDITWPIAADALVHPDDFPTPRLTRLSSMDSGAEYNLTRMDITLHTGTHIDAPRHYLADGATIDQMPPDAAIGPARVTAGLPLDCRPGERILVKGAILTLEAAQQLARCGVRLVGVDSLSVGPGGGEGDAIHRVLLAAGVWLLEGLDLGAVEPGDYELVSLPLRIASADGAPARAFLTPRG